MCKQVQINSYRLSVSRFTSLSLLVATLQEEPEGNNYTSATPKQRKIRTVNGTCKWSALQQESKKYNCKRSALKQEGTPYK